MSLKVVSNYLGHSFKMGRNRAIARGPRLLLKNYIAPKIEGRPQAADYTIAAKDVLSQVLGNSSLGDCTAAAAFHIAGTMMANAGLQTTWDLQSQVVPFYSATGGYVPGKPATDNGANEVDVLNFWQNCGLLRDGSHKILAWVAVDPKDRDEIETAIWLFENVLFGIEMPEAWITPCPSHSGFVWDVYGGPNPDNGHAFSGHGYHQNGVKIATWGMLGTLTWAAIEKYAAHADGGELYTVMSADSIMKATEKAPNGLAIAELTNDIRMLNGEMTS